MTEWLIYRGAGEPHDGIDRLPPPPPWRDFDGGPPLPPDAPLDSASSRRLGAWRGMVEAFRPRAEEVEVINAALYLRRPLLVTGRPGTGKSTIPHAVAYELGLGRVLRWPITSRSTLRDGLYNYDAIGRLQDVQLRSTAHGTGESYIGNYLRLGPMGTALLPYARPRVLLIDEIDKSDVDLPNDLLSVLEEGEFSIPELERVADQAGQESVEVMTDDGRRARVEGGRVRCHAFPFVVLSSNGERDFPAPLMRRCLHLELAPPDQHRLAAMVRAHLGQEAEQSGQDLIERFLSRDPDELLAADQLLNALYLTAFTGDRHGGRERLAEMLLRPLNQPR
ncbi:MoxR family ATPase [Streptomyces sp. NPDC052114]|uniref:AAA family ATPase n=1 Tax=unclassified Streptomyces TaxID=2593676 RepID=UPI0034311C79